MKTATISFDGKGWCGFCSRRIAAGSMRRHVRSKACREGNEQRTAYLFWVGKQPPRKLAERGYHFYDVQKSRGQYFPIYLSPEDWGAERVKELAAQRETMAAAGAELDPIGGITWVQ